MWPLSHKAAHDHSSIEMSAAGIQGLQATYNQVLDEVGVPPENLRPLYNHPAGPTVFFSGLQLQNEDWCALNQLAWPDLQKNSAQLKLLFWLQGLFGQDTHL